MNKHIDTKFREHENAKEKLRKRKTVVREKENTTLTTSFHSYSTDHGNLYCSDALEPVYMILSNIVSYLLIFNSKYSYFFD